MRHCRLTPYGWASIVLILLTVLACFAVAQHAAELRQDLIQHGEIRP